MHNELYAMVACAVLAGCAPTIWDKPGGSQAEFNQDSAKCRLLARGMNPGEFYAQGSPGFVSGATVGNALGTAIAQDSTYQDCMMAVGYTPRERGASHSQADDTGIQTSSCRPGEPCVCAGGPGKPVVCRPDSS